MITVANPVEKRLRVKNRSGLKFVCLKRLKLFDKDYVASASPNGTFSIWNVYTFEFLKFANEKGEAKAIKAHQAVITCFRELADSTLATGSRDKMIKLWNLATGQCKLELKGHSDTVTCLKKFKTLNFISVSADCTVKIWNCQTGECNGL
jgi:WD40 repeat protein